MIKAPIVAFKGKNRFLSNFVDCKVIWCSTIYPTVEHAYQAAKTNDLNEQTAIAKAVSPGQAKRLGQEVTMCSDWEIVKVDVMRVLLQQKFTKEPFRELLVATGDAELTEGNLWGDTFWGVCERTGEGENHLGKLLMELRSEINAGIWEFDDVL